MKIVLIRHGQVLANTQGRYISSTDQPLTVMAREQLLHSAKNYPAVQMVLTSPLLRCADTAKIIYPMHKAVVIPQLRERDFGQFEGKTHAEIIAVPQYKDWGLTEESMVFPDGESRQEFSLRCKRAMLEVLQRAEYAGKSSAAVVCHGGVIMEIMHQLIKPQREYYRWQLKNSQVITIEVSKK